MKRFTEFRQFNNISTKYRVVVVTTLLIFLLSGMHTPGLIAAHAAFQGSTIHIRKHPTPKDNNGTLLWKYQTGGTTSIYGPDSPVVANGVVYYGASGYFYALNVNNGSLLWSNKDNTNNYPPAIANGIAYVDSGILDALNANNGSLLWQFSAIGFANSLSSAPTVANGTVYVNSIQGTLYALNASNGVLLWTCSCGSTNSHSGTVVANGVVYVGTDTDYVDALNASNGTLLWQYQTGGPIQSTPAVANGIVYALSSDGYFYALNASNGSFIWHYSINSCPGCLGFILAAANGIVYVSSEGFYALNASNGSLLWEYSADFAPVLVNGVLYVDGYYNDPGYGYVSAMDALDANTGSLLWSYQLSYSNDVSISGPAAANGVVYFGAAEGPDYVYAVTAPPPAGPQGTERLGGSNPSELGECTRCAGDPIDTYSGNFSHTWTDFSVPGRGIPLLFSRTYNAQAAAQQGPFGYGWTDSYNFALTTDQSGNVTIQQEDGSTVTFAPNGSNGYTAPSRVLATLVQNNDGTYTFTRANQLQYVFNASGQLVQEVDRNGYVTHLTYNSSNQLTTVTDPAGRALTFTYGSNGLIAQITDPFSRSVSFQYDSNNNLTAATDVNGGITHFTYDSNHLLLTMTDPRGGVTTNVYDTSVRVTSQTVPMNRKTTFSYGNSSTTITDPNGNVSVEQYQNGLLMSETEGSGTPQAATTSYTYDPLSLGVASITDPDGHIWTQTWDASGNLLSSTDPLKKTTAYTYDYFNDLISVTDPLKVATTFTYDSHGNLLTVSRPLTGTKKSQTTTYIYGDSSHPGDVTSMTDPDGKMWQYSYDQYGDVASVTDPLTDQTTFQYNAIGWVNAQVSPNGNVSGGKPSAYTTSYTYNAFGDVAQVTDPLGHQTDYQYDTNRNLVKLTNALGQITQYTYDADNEVTQIARADGSTLTYSYDSDGNQTVQRDGLGHATTYAYDPLNRLITTTDPLQRKTSYGYDSASNLTTLTNPAGQVTTYAYDTGNELATITYSDGHTPQTSFTYDADGEQTSMTDGTGKTTYSYDSLNRLTQSTNGAGSAVAYTYDLNGNLIRLTYPGNRHVNRSYNAAGRMVSVQDWLGNTTKFTYDANGNIISEVYPNKVQATFSYDHDDQITNIGDKLGKTKILKLSYTRNNLSLLSSMQASQPSPGNESYTYTPLNQLSTVNQQTFTYDRADNLTQNGTTTQVYDVANEVTSSTNNSLTTTYSYDTQGNRTQMTSPGGQTTTYAYDQANRLTAYGTTATYTYDGGGLRMSKTVSGTTEAFTWDIAEGLPLDLQDGTTQYVYGPGGMPLEQVSSNGTVLYYHQDQLGNTRVLTDATGTTVATYTYGAYGNVTAQTGSVANPFQYAGQYTDAESGLQYMRARYYDPNTGQFLTRDPLAAQTQEPYSYTVGDPLNMVDSSGLYTYKFSEYLGPESKALTAQSAMAALQADPNQYFPFNVTGDAGENRIQPGGTYHLQGAVPWPQNWPVEVTGETSTSFTFTAYNNSGVEPKGSTITFWTCEKGGNVTLHQTAQTPVPLSGLFGQEDKIAPIIAWLQWHMQAANLGNHFEGGPTGQKFWPSLASFIF